MKVHLPPFATFIGEADRLIRLRADGRAR